MELIGAPADADAPDTPDECNPRHELESLERAHLLVANTAAQRILARISHTGE